MVWSCSSSAGCRMMACTAQHSPSSSQGRACTAAEHTSYSPPAIPSTTRSTSTHLILLQHAVCLFYALLLDQERYQPVKTHLCDGADEASWDVRVGQLIHLLRDHQRAGPCAHSLHLATRQPLSLEPETGSSNNKRCCYEAEKAAAAGSADGSHLLAGWRQITIKMRSRGNATQPLMGSPVPGCFPGAQVVLLACMWSQPGKQTTLHSGDNPTFNI